MLLPRNTTSNVWSDTESRSDFSEYCLWNDKLFIANLWNCKLQSKIVEKSAWKSVSQHFAWIMYLSALLLKMLQIETYFLNSENCSHSFLDLEISLLGNVFFDFINVTRLCMAHASSHTHTAHTQQLKCLSYIFLWLKYAFCMEHLIHLSLLDLSCLVTNAL